MKTRFIHIGHHRCGSTFIQKSIMPLITGVTPITYNVNNLAREEIDYLCLCGDLYYDAERNKRLIQEKLSVFEEVCLSFEGFTGLAEVLTSGHQLTYLPRRLRDVFGETRILLVIRNQRAAVCSRYRADVRFGYLSSFEKWFKNMAAHQRHNWLRYHPLCERYADAFGKENVKVVLFEELFRPETFKDIFGFVGMPDFDVTQIDLGRKVNESYTAPVLWMTKVVNRFFGSKLTHGTPMGTDASMRMYNFWRNKASMPINRLTERMGFKAPAFDFDGFDRAMHDLVHDDNRRLEAWLGRPLAEYGYL